VFYRQHVIIRNILWIINVVQTSGARYIRSHPVLHCRVLPPGELKMA